MERLGDICDFASRTHADNADAADNYEIASGESFVVSGSGHSLPIDSAPVPTNVRFSNRPFGVKRFQTIHHYSVNVARGLALLFGFGTKGCQSAFKFDPRSAFKFDPLERRVWAVALAPSELVGVAETARARVVG